jgi:hypothetical protein
MILLAGLGAILWAQQAPSVTGTFQQYLLTPHGEVEGVLLQDGTVVRFPPHMGITLAGIAKPGDEVAVVGFLGPTISYGRAIKALTLTNKKTGQSVVDQPPSTPPMPPDMRGLTRKPLGVRGTVARLLVNDKGDVDGLILSGGEQVKFPPHNGAVLAMMLCRGKNRWRPPVTAPRMPSGLWSRPCLSASRANQSRCPVQDGHAREGLRFEINAQATFAIPAC